MRDVPEVERQEVRTVLQNWGYEGAELDELLGRNGSVETRRRCWSS